MNEGLATSIDPFSRRAITKGSRYYNNISKTGVFNLSMPTNTELRDLEPMEIDGKGTLHILLRVLFINEKVYGNGYSCKIARCFKRVSTIILPLR